MKRNSHQALAQAAEENHKEDHEEAGSDSDSQSANGNELEPGMKRAKMPKKSKHRMRAHINPMGDLTIPV